MGYLYFKVDEQAIKKKLGNELAARADVQSKATSIVNNLFNRIHGSMIREFSEHPITRELKAGSLDPKGTPNISMTLNGEGNLFAFLGFYVGQDPTEDVFNLLMKMRVRKTNHRSNVVNFRVEGMPTEDEIKRATPMNWGNGSWAFGIERGEFSNGADLAHFIFKSWSGSRSSSGFQVKGYEYSEEKFSPRPYLSEILDNFAHRVNNSRSKFLT